MSGGVGLILGVTGWSESPADQKKYFLIASVACLLVSSFAVWYSERKERLRLEAEAGPNLLLKIVRKQAGLEVVQLISDGRESALNVELEESAEERIKITAIPWGVPFVRDGENRELRVICYEYVRNGTHGSTLCDFLRSDLEQMNLAVRFENARGTKFRRRFILRRSLLDNEVQCYPGPRELIR